MENHPIPQQISSYQFRLVGDMTLKQFFQVAGGCLVSLIFYASKLHPLIKWPIILFFALLGVALAFLPFEDRPLETWIISFFKSIYSPTLFKWEKMNTVPSFYQEEASVPQTQVLAPQGKEKLEEYLGKTTEQKLPFLSKLEEKEQEFLKTMGNIFSQGSPNSGNVVVQQTQPTTNKINIPISKPTYVAPKLVTEEKPQVDQKISPQYTNVSQTLQSQDFLAKKQAEFSVDAAPPNPPSIPNTIVGQVVDDQRKIVEGAILEVRDIAGRPIRALKSNKLGHFLVVTPLSNGTYEISTEKEGYVFEPVSFAAEGKIIPPIAVKGKKQIVQKIEESLIN